MTIMRVTASPALLLNNREGKEAKLKEFIAQDLAALKEGARDSTARRYTVIARAPDSVVAQALRAAAAEIEAASIEISAIVFESEACFEESPQYSAHLELNTSECRYLRDQRFAAAHEQLVLSTGRVWIGDCMRRDPAKRDAFEYFHDANASAVQHATQSFNRLWAHAKPLQRVSGASGLAPGVLVAGESKELGRRTANTRR